MNNLTSFLRSWPVPIAALLCGAMIFSTAADQVILPHWLVDLFDTEPDQQKPPVPKPEPNSGVPYAPAPGRDDRTPVAFVSQVFGLNDPALPVKLSGIGPVFWDHAGQGSGTLIAPNLVLTTGHLFAERGKWDGPHGLTEKPPAPSDGRIYLEVCGKSYDFKAIHMGTMAPRARLGSDYAIAELVAPACAEATILPVAQTPDDLANAGDQILLNMGAYRFKDLERYAAHPLFASRTGGGKHAQYAVFGVKCVATGREDTGDVAGGSTGVVVTKGCDGIPGGSGGALLASRDGGASYAVVGVTNSYRPTTEFNNFTSIEGAFAKHLAQFVDLVEVPVSASASPAAPSHIAKQGPLGPWEEIQIQTEEYAR